MGNAANYEMTMISHIFTEQHVYVEIPEAEVSKVDLLSEK